MSLQRAGVVRVMSPPAECLGTLGVPAFCCEVGHGLLLVLVACLSEAVAIAGKLAAIRHFTPGFPVHPAGKVVTTKEEEQIRRGQGSSQANKLKSSPPGSSSPSSWTVSSGSSSSSSSSIRNPPRGEVGTSFPTRSDSWGAFESDRRLFFHPKGVLPRPLGEREGPSNGLYLCPLWRNGSEEGKTHREYISHVAPFG